LSSDDRILGFELADVRFPTSLSGDGSDAMNPDPDYAAAYVEIHTARGPSGHGFAFTLGSGNDIQLAAIGALEQRFAGLEAEPLLADMGATWRWLVHDSPLRWLGPEKGVMHMAIGAVVNALWDMRAKREALPLWLLLARLSPEEIIELVDFRYLSDALTPGEALEILRRAEPGREQRIEQLIATGYPAYATTPGWLGYSDAKLAELCRDSVQQGFRQIKLKVGASLDDDRRRCRIARDAVGDDVAIAIDANQVWDVEPAIEWIRALAPFGLAWVEEPTHPDDILGHARIRAAVAPIRIASGEHTAGRVMFKQLLQAGAIDVMQIDATRVAGVNENIANILLAAKFGVPVCPHAGGVGLCEAVQHLAMWDYVAVSATQDERMIEWRDRLHEHFVDPAVIANGRYVAPAAPGASTELLRRSRDAFTFPQGAMWQPARAGLDASGEMNRL
jgi:L-fuconate dehydratase